MENITFKSNFFKILSLFLFVVLFIFVCVIINIFSPRWKTNKYIEPRVIVNTSWKVKVNNCPITVPKLPYSLPIFVEDNFSIERVLGMSSVIAGPTLYFKTVNQAIRVLCDNEEIYSSGIKMEKSLGVVNGRSIHFVNLPDDCHEKVTKIEFYPLAAGEAFTIPTIYLGTKYGCVLNFFFDNLRSLIISFILLSVGLVYILLYIFAIYKKTATDEYKKMIKFSMATSLLIFIETSTLQIFINNSFLICFLYAVCIPFIPYYIINSLQSSYIFKIQKRELCLFKIICLAVLILYILSLFFTWMPMHIVDIINVIFFGFALIYFGAMTLFRVFKRKLNIDEYFVAFWIMFLGIVSDFIFYFINVEHKCLITYTSICLVIFFIIRGVSVTKTYFSAIEKNIKHKMLENMAYTDILTGLKNRTAFEERQKEIIFSDTVRPGLIIFDINNLKLTNDIYGHQSGDKMIKTFSNLLSEIFPVGKVFRIGGDEFCVIMEKATEKGIKSRLRKLEVKIQETNSNKENTKVSAAMGYGIYTPGKDDGFEGLFKRVDMLMYAHKQEQKRSSDAYGQNKD